MRAERDRITAEYRDLITDEADLKQFDELLGCAKTVFPYVENHLFYVEHWFHSVFWNKMREVAAILKDHGMINDIEDVWYLRRDEIKQALWDVVTAWATGVTPRGTFTWPPEIEWRKGVMEKFRQWSPPPAIGIAPEVIQEPFTIVLWGVTNKSLSDWAAVQDVGDPDSITELKGFAGSPGIVEGKARVCRTAKDIRDLQEGEILVAPTTSPSWAPAFRQDQGLRHRRRRGHEPCRHRLPRVRHAGNRGYRAFDQDDQDRNDAQGRWFFRCDLDHPLTAKATDNEQRSWQSKNLARRLAMDSATPMVCWFQECNKDSVDLVGGKCSSLGELINAGVRVPPGFRPDDPWLQRNSCATRASSPR